MSLQRTITLVNAANMWFRAGGLRYGSFTGRGGGGGGGGGGGSGTGCVPGEHCHPGKQICAASQSSPGKQVVPAVGEGMAPGVQRHPAWHICPNSQMLPGMHTADRGGSCGGGLSGGVGPGGVGPVGPGGVVGTTHPLSNKRSGQARIGLTLATGNVIRRPRS